MESMSHSKGLRTCVYLCLLLAKVNLYFLNHLKSLRYIVQTIDALFNAEHTRRTMLLALSIVFPLDR